MNISDLKLQFFHVQYLFCVCVAGSYDVDLHCLDIYILGQFNMIIFVCITVSDFRMIRVDTNKQTRSNIIGFAKSERAQLLIGLANRQSTRVRESHMKRSEMLVVLLSGINQGFWSLLGCWG